MKFDKHDPLKHNRYFAYKTVEIPVLEFFKKGSQLSENLEIHLTQIKQYVKDYLEHGKS